MRSTDKDRLDECDVMIDILCWKSDWNERRLCDVNWNEDRFGPYAQYMYGVLTMSFGYCCNLRIVLIRIHR